MRDGMERGRFRSPRVPKVATKEKVTGAMDRTRICPVQKIEKENDEGHPANHQQHPDEGPVELSGQVAGEMAGIKRKEPFPPGPLKEALPLITGARRNQIRENPASVLFPDWKDAEKGEEFLGNQRPGILGFLQDPEKRGKGIRLESHA